MIKARAVGRFLIKEADNYDDKKKTIDTYKGRINNENTTTDTVAT